MFLNTLAILLMDPYERSFDSHNLVLKKQEILLSYYLAQPERQTILEYLFKSQ